MLCRQPRKVNIIHNPNPKVLEKQAKSGKTVTIDKIDGKAYEGGGIKRG